MVICCNNIGLSNFLEGKSNCEEVVPRNPQMAESVLKFDFQVTSIQKVLNTS